jgi:alpha-D-xyloside xylohydrolase
LPLYVRPGSIIPLGPDEEYAAERPPDPLEVRVYTGADGNFLLYEDENDSYNYEQGVHATIPMRWNEQSQVLTIGERKGSFPGMLQHRKLHIIFVRPGHGVGPAVTEKPDKVVEYTGNEISVTR